MSRENVELVRTIYAAWGRGEFAETTSLMDPEIEYVNPSSAVEPGTHRGIEALIAATARVSEGWSSWEMEPEDLQAIGEQVVVVVHYRSRGRSSGIEVEGRESALWTIRDGKVLRYEWFNGPDDALAAAGSLDGR